jgi:glycosyltransferase involved in cell wall biosynthesis
VSRSPPNATTQTGAGKRVLLVLPWLTRGGAERAAIEQARALSEGGFELICATTAISPHEWADQLRRYCGEMVFLGEAMPPFAQPSAILRLLRDRAVDVLFLVNSWVGMACLPHAKATLPRLATVDYQHSDNQTAGADFARQSCARFDRLLDRRLVATEYLRARYQAYGVARDKIRVIRGGCDTLEFDPERIPSGALRARAGFAADAPIVGFIGRMVEEKDPLFVARVFAELGRRVPGLRFAFLGDGPLKPAVIAEVTRAGMGGNTVFLPADTDVATVLRDLSLLLMASRVEGLPLVFCEALAMRVPVVSTAVEGIPELITGEVGACVPDEGDPSLKLERLVAAAAALLGDEARRREAGRRGRRKVEEEFSVARAREQYRDALIELVGIQTSNHSLRIP